jgi:hypothetical protein
LEKEELPIPEKIKYKEDEPCPVCKINSGFSRTTDSLNSFVYCEECGAQFHNVMHEDREKKGVFTGVYREISRSKEIKYSFKQEKQ